MPDIVLCHGTFDLLHLGHIRHLQEAAELGDELVVSITSDRYVNKGIGRPHFTAEERAEILNAIDCVDTVIINDAPNAKPVIDAVKPKFFVKGCDYTNSKDPDLAAEIAAVEAVGGQFTTTESVKFSSSRLLNSTRPEVAAYLEAARSRNFLDKIQKAFVKADKLDIAFIGENIIDEYRYVKALNKPSKEFILATAFSHREVFEGGVVAAGNHMDWSNVKIVTGGLPVTKTRFVDVDFNKKLFEVYSTPRLVLQTGERAQFRKDLARAVRDSDAVVVFDFGHGLMDETERKSVGHAKYLAVNAQTNAANNGFNLATKYHGAELVCVDESEARLATGLQDHSAEAVCNILSLRMNCNAVMTRGRNGCIGFDPKFAIPAFATLGIDTIGAGDAFLATAGPLVAAGLELEAAAFAGNVAGAIKTTIVGHRRHVTRTELMQNVKALLA